jgi:polysaccharide pyruvyl transferase WcaK-like protein
VIRWGNKHVGKRNLGDQMSPKEYNISREDYSYSSPRIALLTPYSGGNLGDAAIQDAMIANLGRRLPDAQFSGICLNCENFVARHGADAFPLSATYLEFYYMIRGLWGERPKEVERRGSIQWIRDVTPDKIRIILKSLPILGRCLKVLAAIPREVSHCFKGYRFLRTQDLLIVSGGGQLNEQYGGAWAQPFALFKWAILARMARVPYAVASVGLGELKSTAARLFVRGALRSACYRSYRDDSTKDFATGLMRQAETDPVVPDLAFSLTSLELPKIASIDCMARGRTVIAISPIAYAKPGRWPIENSAMYNRYVKQFAQLVAQLLWRNYFLVIVWSSLGDDESVIADLLECLDQDSKQRLAVQLHIPPIGTWKDFVSFLGGADFLIASRLHSAILGFMSGTPTIAISFDRKVSQVMKDLGQTDYLLQFDDFTADNVLQALDRLQLCTDAVSQRISSYRDRVLPTLAEQYDALVDIAIASRRTTA